MGGNSVTWQGLYTLVREFEIYTDDKSRRILYIAYSTIIHYNIQLYVTNIL